MALTDTAIRLAEAEASDRKLADSKGLDLLVLPKMRPFRALVALFALLESGHEPRSWMA